MKGNHDSFAVALAGIPFLRPWERELLIDLFPSGDGFLSLGTGDLSSILRRGIPGGAFSAEAALRKGEADARVMRERGVFLARRGEPGYPRELAEIHDPPFALFVRGSPRYAELPGAAVVGTRKPSAAGKASASRFGSELAGLGFAVVSGLALGIDAWAHRGAVDSGGPTVAVLACGPDTVYPRSNAALARRILDSGGALVSEYPPGTEPLKWRFPGRNRIIAGLSRVVLVVEAPEKSGALITAQFALDEGRDVAVAASVLSGPLSAGARGLAADGARAVCTAAELAGLNAALFSRRRVPTHGNQGETEGEDEG